MTTEEIIYHIDQEIARLTTARNLVAGTGGASTGRTPRKSAAVSAPVSGVKRVISPEGRARIAAAQKLRWAKQKRAKTKSA